MNLNQSIIGRLCYFSVSSSMNESAPVPVKVTCPQTRGQRGVCQGIRLSSCPPVPRGACEIKVGCITAACPEDVGLSVPLRYSYWCVNRAVFFGNFLGCRESHGLCRG